jgi:hypothetical protein
MQSLSLLKDIQFQCKRKTHSFIVFYEQTTAAVTQQQQNTSLSGGTYQIYEYLLACFRRYQKEAQKNHPELDVLEGQLEMLKQKMDDVKFKLKFARLSFDEVNDMILSSEFRGKSAARYSKLYPPKIKKP